MRLKTTIILCTLMALLTGLYGCGGLEKMGINNPFSPSIDDSTNSPTQTVNVSAKIVIIDERFGQRVAANGDEPVEIIIHIQQPDFEQEETTNTDDGNVTVDDLEEGPTSVVIDIPEWDSSYGGGGILEEGTNLVIVAAPGSLESFTQEVLDLMIYNGYSFVFDYVAWEHFLSICKGDINQWKEPEDAFIEIIGIQRPGNEDFFWADFSTGKFEGNVNFRETPYSGKVYINQNGSGEWHLNFDAGSFRSEIGFVFELYKIPRIIEITVYHLTRRNWKAEKCHTIQIVMNSVNVDRFYSASDLDWYTHYSWSSAFPGGTELANHASPGTNELTIGRPSGETATSEYWLKWVRIRCIY